MKITVLGCGSSSGVPMIGCVCKVCKSNNSRNNRTRVSIIVEHHGKRILVDTSPDLRQQALRNGIESVDAIIFTHDHADHTHGIDETRSFNYKLDKAINAYSDKDTLEILESKFPYVFKPKPEEKKWFRPSLNPIVVDFEGEYEIAGIKVTTFPQIHGRLKTLGLRFGDFAYSTDTNNLSDDAFKRLEGVKIWVVDCLSFTEKPSHAHLDLTLSWINRVKPDLAVLTHMSHEFDYDELLRNLPQGVEPAYDGMVLTLED